MVVAPDQPDGGFRCRPPTRAGPRLRRWPALSLPCSTGAQPSGTGSGGAGRSRRAGSSLQSPTPGRPSRPVSTLLWARRLRPLFVELPDSTPYARRGRDTYRDADEAVLDLASFDLTGDRMTALRRDVTTARWRPRWPALASWQLPVAAAAVLHRAPEL